MPRAVVLYAASFVTTLPVGKLIKSQLVNFSFFIFREMSTFL